jgi:hypothetical protein
MQYLLLDSLCSDITNAKGSAKVFKVQTEKIESIALDGDD